MWQRGNGPVVDLGDTAGETAEAIVEVCSLILEQGLHSAQHAMCQTRTVGLKEEEVSPLLHFAA